MVLVIWRLVLPACTLPPLLTWLEATATNGELRSRISPIYRARITKGKRYTQAILDLTRVNHLDEKSLVHKIMRVTGIKPSDNITPYRA